MHTAHVAAPEEEPRVDRPAITRVSKPPPAHAARDERQAADTLYPRGRIRGAAQTRAPGPVLEPGTDLAAVELAVLSDEELAQGRRAQLLNYARELAAHYPDRR